MSPAVSHLSLLQGFTSRISGDQLISEIEAELLRRNFREYQKAAWQVKHPGKRLVWGMHHDAIGEHLEACKRGEIQRLIINVHPRSLKSETVSVDFPSWWWIDDPTIQFLAASADRDVVYRDADALRDLCASKWYRGTFRPDWSFHSDGSGSKQGAKGYYRNTAGGHRISKAIGQRGQGVNADVIIIDDPLDASDAYNDKAQLTEHVVHFKQRLLTRLNDEDTGVVIIIMQRLHELDLSGVLLAEGGWDHLYLPAEYDGRKVVTSIGWSDPRTEEGELLDPIRLPAERLAQKRIDLGARGYAGQYMQRPAPAAGAMILREWINYWTPDTLPDMDYMIGSWDFQGKEDRKVRGSDFVAGQVWGVCGEDRYLLDQIHARMNLPDMIRSVREMEKVWPGMRAIVVELAAAGKDVIATLERELYSLHPFKPGDRSKQQRVAATLPRWEQGHVYIPHPQLCSTPEHDYSWVSGKYIPETVSFPGARHDDQVDATSQALLWIDENGPAMPMVERLG
jgi:predicted phage terminase large subunit-like protein